MNEGQWYHHILREQLLPTIQEQFGDEQCLFQEPFWSPEVIWQHARVDCRGLEKEGSRLQILTLCINFMYFSIKAFDTYEMLVIILQYSIVTSDKNI